MEEWTSIPDFPGYLVSSMGFVRRETATQDISIRINNTGTACVSLWREGRSHNRSLPRLVADAFLPRSQLEAFDTPINLNGDGLDNRVSNLMWRPRWFAIKYHRQFNKKWNGWNKPIMLFNTGEVFPNSWTAAMQYGLINDDLVVAIANGDQIWPTGHRYLPYKPHIKQRESHAL
jgi:hypothetical protein